MTGQARATLLIWRHGNTDWNEQQRIQGSADTPLNQLGHQQAAAAAPLLAARTPALIVSSDLSRCTATAAPLAARTGLAVRLDARLRERAYGQWEGLRRPDIAQRWPDAYARWRAGADAADVGHGVERPAEVMKRVGEALREVVESMPPGGTAVVVTHGGSARYGMVELLGWPLEQVRTMSGLGNCHVVELRHQPDRGWLLHAYNLGAGEPEGTG